MDDAAVVRRGERFGDLSGNREGIGQRQTTITTAAAGQVCRQRLAIDELEHEHRSIGRRFDPVNGGDVRMLTAASSRASRSTCASDIGAGVGRRGTFSATSRSRRRSRARYTSPMPPVPISDFTSKPATPRKGVGRRKTGNPQPSGAAGRSSRESPRPRPRAPGSIRPPPAASHRRHTRRGGTMPLAGWTIECGVAETLDVGLTLRLRLRHDVAS